jgi:hypothetical protein
MRFAVGGRRGRFLYVLCGRWVVRGSQTFGLSKLAGPKRTDEAMPQQPVQLSVCVSVGVGLRSVVCRSVGLSPACPPATATATGRPRPRPRPRHQDRPSATGSVCPSVRGQSALSVCPSVFFSFSHIHSGKIAGMCHHSLSSPTGVRLIHMHLCTTQYRHTRHRMLPTIAPPDYHTRYTPSTPF